MNIGKSIRVACAMNGWTQKDLSTASGISTVTISHLVSGKTGCKQKTLEALTSALGMPVSEFVALGEG